MGDRFILTVTCPFCGFVDDDVYYAPASGAKMWKCPECGMVVGLPEHIGGSKESNRDLLDAALNGFE